MEKTIKLIQLVSSKDAMTKLNACPLPLEISWKLKKFMLKAQDELRVYEEERVKHVVELGKENVEGSGNFTVLEENKSEYFKRLDAIEARDITLDIPDIKIGELLKHRDNKGNPINIATADLMLLDWLITE